MELERAMELAKDCIQWRGVVLDVLNLMVILASFPNAPYFTHLCYFLVIVS